MAPRAPSQHSSSPVLAYQLDVLKVEIGIINSILERQDGITQATKNWSVVTWTASVGFALGRDDLRPFLLITALVPMLFWFIDAVWRRLQSRSTFRMFRIRDFINSDDLGRSFELGRLQGFVVLDPVGTQYKGTEPYKRHVSLGRTLRFREVAVFYAVPALVSVFLAIYFAWLK
jgi:hypothetical protein